MNSPNRPDVAVCLELPFQINAQGNVVLMAAENSCHAFVSLWDEQGSEMPRLGKFQFIQAWASQYFAAENGGLYCTADREYIGFAARIENSIWLAECVRRRLARYPDWLQWDKRTYHHFVLAGHDNCVEVIAERFETSLATEAENDLFYNLCL